MATKGQKFNKKRTFRNKPFKPVKYPYGFTKDREEVLKDISEFYSDYQYSKEIRNMRIDMPRLHENERKVNIDEYVRSIYERYNLLVNKDTKRPFTNENDYGDYLRRHTPYDDEQISMLYKEYVHVYRLVMSGQYEEYRTNQFRENYINAMKQSGLPDYAIKNLEKLSYEQFKTLAEQRNPVKDKNNKWRLPTLGGFDYRTAGTIDKMKYSSGAVEQIRELFKELGYDWLEPENVMGEHLPKLSKARKYSSNVRKTIRRFNRIYNVSNNRPIERYYSEETPVSELLERSVATMSRLSSKMNQTVKRSKSGNYYIPFIGSTRKGTKNRNLLLDIVDLLGLDYD